MGLFLSIVFGFVPMFLFAGFVYWLDRYEKEPLRLLGGVFLWGAAVAAGIAYVVNTIFGISIYLVTRSEIATEFTTSTVVAPLVEETLKAIAVLIVYLAARKEFDSVLDGIIYASVVALGFAATENTLYIYNRGFIKNGYEGLFTLVFIRVILVGWQHPFYTAFTGIGLAFSRLNRNIAIKIFAPFLGWCIGVLAHSLHNLIANLLTGIGGLVISTIFDWSGWLIMFGFVLWMVHKEKQSQIKYLREEVDLGVMTITQYQTACSAWAQSWARFSSLFNRKYKATNQFYQLCGELAHRKQLLDTMGESENLVTIEKLREDLAALALLLPA